MALYFVLGVAVGSLGTLMGIGGGIVLVPVLLTLYPELSPAEITAISLFCVAANSITGSISYLIKKKVHIPSAILYSLACLPGTWLGVQLNAHLNRSTYEKFFGAFMLFMGAYLLIRKSKPHINLEMSSWKPTKQKYIWGTIGSFFVGVLASLLGLGGGIIHVPFLIEVIQFPVHTAVATSHSILAISSSAASIEHYLNGTLNFNHSFVLYIAAGIVLGAPLGAKISSKVKGTTIVKCLGVALILAALRLMFL